MQMEGCSCDGECCSYFFVFCFCFLTTTLLWRIYSFSILRSLALLLRGFFWTSASLGRIGFFVSILIMGVRPQRQRGNEGGQTQPVTLSLKHCFTNLSSPE